MSAAHYQAEAWRSQVNFEEENAEAQAYGSHHDAAVELAIDMPTSNRGWKSLEADMAGYFVANRA